MAERLGAEKWEEKKRMGSDQNLLYLPPIFLPFIFLPALFSHLSGNVRSAPYSPSHIHTSLTTALALPSLRKMMRSFPLV